MFVIQLIPFFLEIELDLFVNSNHQVDYYEHLLMNHQLDKWNCYGLSWAYLFIYSNFGGV